jgi:hypothetical protein
MDHASLQSAEFGTKDNREAASHHHLGEDHTFEADSKHGAVTFKHIPQIP